jgi:hypothetical protein
MNRANSGKVLVVEPTSIVMDRLVGELLERGTRVSALPAPGRLPPYGAEVPRIDLPSYEAGDSDDSDPFGTIIFDLPRIDERSLFADGGGDPKNLSDLADEAYRFLDLTKRMITHQVFREKGSIWTLECDDFFEYYFTIPISPIFSSMRISCFRSLCKEFARFNLQFNNIVFQPGVESVPAAEYKAQLPNLKVFSLKFRLSSLERIAAAICDQIENASASMNGSVVHLGVSPNWNNY